MPAVVGETSSESNAEVRAPVNLEYHISTDSEWLWTRLPAPSASMRGGAISVRHLAQRKGPRCQIAPSSVDRLHRPVHFRGIDLLPSHATNAIDDDPELLIALERIRSVHQAIPCGSEVGRVGQFFTQAGLYAFQAA